MFSELLSRDPTIDCVVLEKNMEMLAKEKPLYVLLSAPTKFLLMHLTGRAFPGLSPDPLQKQRQEKTERELPSFPKR